MSEKVKWNFTVPFVGAKVEKDDDDNVSIQDVSRAMHEHLPDTVDALQAKDKSRTAERVGELTDYAANEQAELQQRAAKIEDAFNRDVWDEQLQAAADVHDQASYDKYLHGRDQLQTFVAWRRERDREQL